MYNKTKLAIHTQHIKPFRSYVETRPTRFLLRLFALCRSLSDAFPHVVRTLANK
jgi:hypothetical protein